MKAAARALADAAKRECAPPFHRRGHIAPLQPLAQPKASADTVDNMHAGLALELYRQSMRRDEREKAALSALIEGADWTAAYADETFAGKVRASGPESDLSAGDNL